MIKTILDFQLNIKTVAGLNARENRHVRAKRVAKERAAAERAARHVLRGAQLAPPFIVTLTRLSAGVLDDDNLAGACKAIRDGVADALGVDDGNRRRIRWCYEQARCERGKHGVLVQIAMTSPGAVAA